MCETIGLTVTGHFSSHHDLLICRRADGPKYQKSREWRKPVVSLNWLAEVRAPPPLSVINRLQQSFLPSVQSYEDNCPFAAVVSNL